MPILLFALLLALDLPMGAQPSPAPKAPPKLDQPHAGTDVVTGKTLETAWPVLIKVFDSSGNPIQQREVLVNAPDLTVVAGFPHPLRAGEIVQASFDVGGVEMLPSAPVIVGGPNPLGASSWQAHAPPQPDPLQIVGHLAPGAANVYVVATPTPANSGYEVRIYGCGEGVPAGVRDSSGFRSYAVTDATGLAAITFEQPLSDSQSVKLCQKIVSVSDPSVPAVEAPGAQATTVANPLDLGRVHYYFTSGVVLSNDQGFQLAPSGTQASLFLGLNADRTWLPLDDNGFRRVNFNTYLDARLTSVPAQSATASSTALGSFIESRKAASFQAGVYLPLIAGQPWSSGRGIYSLFVAPLAKASLTTLAGNTGTSSGAYETLPVTGRFFSSYAYGTRLGVYQHFHSRSAAPELVSYLDFAVGRFGDFESFRDLTLEQNPNAGGSGPHEFLRYRPWRYSLEGLFKVPNSPIVVGFNANMGSRWPAAKDLAGTRPFNAAPDDLRFLIGAQFDFSKFLKALPGL
jgi:hypothetical protein